MKNFISINALPLNTLFIDLPFKEETIQFTGVISKQYNNGIDNFKSVEIIKTNSKGQREKSCISFFYDMNLSDYVKRIDCNFYERTHKL